MDLKSVKDNLLVYVKTVELDLAKLKSIAEEAVKPEIEEIKAGRKIPRPTTNPHGNGYEPTDVAESRCTIPITMVCFAVMDFLGQMISSHESQSKNSDLNKFGLRAQVFFKQLAGRDDLKNPKTASQLNEFYRNSIMHSFLPMTDKAIGFTVSYTYHINDHSLFDRSYKGKEILNIRYLVERVNDGLKRFAELLQELNETSEIFLNYEKLIG